MIKPQTVLPPQFYQKFIEANRGRDFWTYDQNDRIRQVAKSIDMDVFQRIDDPWIYEQLIRLDVMARSEVALAMMKQTTHDTYIWIAVIVVSMSALPLLWM